MSSPARRRRCAATRASARSCATARSPTRRSSASPSRSPSTTTPSPGIALHARTARQAGIGLDELALAREFDSRDEREATLLRYLKALVEGQGKPPMHLHEEAREAGWTDEQILEAVAVVALEGFTAMVNVAGDVPVDGSTEDARTLKAA